MTKTSKKKGGKEKKHSKEENELTLNVYFKEGTEMKFLFLNGGRLVPHIVTSNRPSDTVSCRLVVKAKFLSGEALHPSRWISCGIGKEKMENSVVSWDTDPQQQGGLHGSITATWTGTLLFECGRLFTANKGKFSSLHFSLNIEPNVFPEAKIYCQNGISMIQLRQFKLVGVLPKGLSSKKFLSNVEQRMHHASPVGRMPVCTSTSTSTSTASTSSPSSSSSSSASHQRQSYFCQGGPQSNGSGLLKTSNSGALVHVKQEIDCDDNLDVGDVDMESSRTEFPNDDSVASSEEEESSDCGSDADSEEEDEDEDEDEERVLKRKFSAVEMASRMTAGNQLGSQVAYSADAGGKEEGEKYSGALAEGYDTLLYDQRETVPLSLSYGGFSMADSSNILSIGDREDVNVSNYKRRKIVGASDVSSNDPFFITDGPTQTFPTFSFLNDDEDATSLDEMDMGGIEDDEHSPFAAGNASLAMENMNKTKEDTISQSSLHARYKH